MITDASTPILYGASWCVPCKELRKWLNKKHILYTYIDVETIEGGQDELDRNNINTIPTLVVGNVRLHSPTEQELGVQFPT